MLNTVQHMHMCDITQQQCFVMNKIYLKHIHTVSQFGFMFIQMMKFKVFTSILRRMNSGFLRGPILKQFYNFSFSCQSIRLQMPFWLAVRWQIVLFGVAILLVVKFISKIHYHWKVFCVFSFLPASLHWLIFIYILECSLSFFSVDTTQLCHLLWFFFQKKKISLVFDRDRRPSLYFYLPLFLFAK